MSSMPPPSVTGPAGPRTFGGGQGSAQAPSKKVSLAEFDINKEPPALNPDEFFTAAEHAAREDLNQLQQILSEFEELNHEFELWTQRLVSVQQDHYKLLEKDVRKLKKKYKEQERVRAKVLAFVRSMMDARTIYQAGGGDVDMDNDDEDDA